jgi:hypothetical protein
MYDRLFCDNPLDFILCKPTNTSDFSTIMPAELPCLCFSHFKLKIDGREKGIEMIKHKYYSSVASDLSTARSDVIAESWLVGDWWSDDLQLYPWEIVL